MTGVASVPGRDLPVPASREALERLEALAALAVRWTARINLVASSTVPDLWDRHVVDSAALWAMAPPDARTWADLGAGGGFPGLVVAVLAADRAGPRVTLIESDGRKCAFLRTAARELSLDVGVLDQRVEEAAPQAADVVSARALAPLPRLLPLVARHLAPGGTAILPKGRGWEAEVEEARAAGWSFALEACASATDPHARILVLRELAHG